MTQWPPLEWRIWDVSSEIYQPTFHYPCALYRMLVQECRLTNSNIVIHCQWSILFIDLMFVLIAWGERHFNILCPCIQYYVIISNNPTSQASGSQTGGHGPPGGHGAIAGSHGRILKKYIFQGLILKNGLFEFLEIFTH